MTKVMIADDDPSVLSSTAFLLERIFGYQVVTVSRASEIFEAIRREHPDILLQDVRMPGLNIASHLQAIRSDGHTASLPVLIFTGASEEGMAQAVGADATVGKPFNPETLRELIETWAHHRHVSRP